MCYGSNHSYCSLLILSCYFLCLNDTAPYTNFRNHVAESHALVSLCELQCLLFIEFTFLYKWNQTLSEQNRLKDSITKIQSVSRIMWLQFMHYYGYSFRIYVAIYADSFETLVPCARRQGFLRRISKPSTDFIQFLFSEHPTFQQHCMSSVIIIWIFLFGELKHPEIYARIFFLFFQNCFPHRLLYMNCFCSSVLPHMCHSDKGNNTTD